MYNTSTNTNTTTYTVLDIRKTFEGLEADLKMIARRTEKWSVEMTDKVFHDILKLAEAKYLSGVDITLLDSSNNPIRACKYAVEENGNANTSDRAGGNDWPNIANTTLTVILSYNFKWHALTAEQQQKFTTDNFFKLSWTTSDIDSSYSNLTKNEAQLFASKGYELKKTNFK